MPEQLHTPLPLGAGADAKARHYAGVVASIHAVLAGVSAATLGGGGGGGAAACL
jgi:hypothetical protein